MMNKLYIKIQYVYACLFGHPLYQNFNQLIVTLGLRGLGINNFENGFISGERFFLKKLKKKRKKPIIIDVGAHYGGYANEVLDIIPNAQLFSFEPHPVSFSFLQKLSNSKGFYAFNIGLSDRERYAYLYDKDDTGSQKATIFSSALNRVNENNVKKYKIKLTSIDSIFYKFIKNNNIDLLKIDVEGAEMDVLRGAQTVLSMGAIDAIQFEFNSMNVHSRTFLTDFKNYLPNFTLYRLLPYGMIKLSDEALYTEIFGFQNIVAVRKD